jgi:hypothetical protein
MVVLDRFQRKTLSLDIWIIVSIVKRGIYAGYDSPPDMRICLIVRFTARSVSELSNRSAHHITGNAGFDIITR